jgi:hypothetical protein
MLQGASHYKESFATAYIEQIAYQKTGYQNTLVYARFAGKPTFVKAMAGNVIRGNQLRVQFKDDIKYLHGSLDSRCLYHKQEKIAIATYYFKKLFSHNSDITFIIGHSMDEIDEAIHRILKIKPIVFHPTWDIKGILTELQLITQMESYNVIAYEIIWDAEKIHEYLSKLVKEKTLTF